ncbi:hypothetical protein BDK51DRAFT_26055, partial [Blyttiomyces helicus]
MSGYPTDSPRQSATGRPPPTPISAGPSYSRPPIDPNRSCSLSRQPSTHPNPDSTQPYHRGRVWPFARDNAPPVDIGNTQDSRHSMLSDSDQGETADAVLRRVFSLTSDDVEAEIQGVLAMPVWDVRVAGPEARTTSSTRVSSDGGSGTSTPVIASVESLDYEEQQDVISATGSALRLIPSPHAFRSPPKSVKPAAAAEPAGKRISVTVVINGPGGDGSSKPLSTAPTSGNLDPNEMEKGGRRRRRSVSVSGIARATLAQLLAKPPPAETDDARDWKTFVMLSINSIGIIYGDIGEMPTVHFGNSFFHFSHNFADNPAPSTSVGSSEMSANVPPSPSLSAFMMQRTYFTHETTKIVQMMKDVIPCRRCSQSVGSDGS